MRNVTPSMHFWEAHYAKTDASWAPHPNVALERAVSLATDTPGKALDVGCGHGGDALWLARKGWHVTAVDVSPTAVARTAARARTAGLAGQVNAIVTDLDQETPEGMFDLVTVSYFHTPVQIDRAAAIRRVATLVAPSGTLLVVDHASVAPWSWNQEPTVFPTPVETLATLQLDDIWTVLQAAALSRTATGPAGETATVVENVITIRRAA